MSKKLHLTVGQESVVKFIAESGALVNRPGLDMETNYQLCRLGVIELTQVCVKYTFVLTELGKQYAQKRGWVVQPEPQYASETASVDHIRAGDTLLIDGIQRRINHTARLSGKATFYFSDGSKQTFQTGDYVQRVVCPRCNGNGVLAVRGDDDTPCPECNTFADADIPFAAGIARQDDSAETVIPFSDIQIAQFDQWLRAAEIESQSTRPTPLMVHIPYDGETAYSAKPLQDARTLEAALREKDARIAALEAELARKDRALKTRFTRLSEALQRHETFVRGLPKDPIEAADPFSEGALRYAASRFDRVVKEVRAFIEQEAHITRLQGK